ncbi:uncharacterized protein LOC106776751 [Vigna radiata var. radiata]|uniref:Uncharacterized protein LOC106776751 n=1 Tax=Vigna radiata var. radiata TaxID=3916 RepID=A0A1S3VMV8_VIGRR|nr:uncharacterized protein LOC106776751 [Vigna radiata var. radiata]
MASSQAFSSCSKTGWERNSQSANDGGWRGGGIIPHCKCGDVVVSKVARTPQNAGRKLWGCRHYKIDEEISIFVAYLVHNRVDLQEGFTATFSKGNNNSLLQKLLARFKTEFAIKDLGHVNYFLGLEVHYTTDGIFLSQTKYAQDILSRAQMLDAKPAVTPLQPHIQLTTTGDPFSDPTQYRSLVGALQYLTITHPDLSYAVNLVSQFLQAPTIDHFQAVKHILRYVKGTMSYGLSFTRGASLNVLGYSDADWARCIETRRSTYGYYIFLGGNLISWSAKKQPTVARSSCESEYRAMANAAAELIWLTHLLHDLHISHQAPTLLCDNKSAILLSQNPVAHKRAKHIDIDYHFVRELILSHKLITQFIPSDLQLANIFTKSLPRPLFQFFRAKLHVGPNPTHCLRGDDRK